MDWALAIGILLIVLTLGAVIAADVAEDARWAALSDLKRRKK